MLYQILQFLLSLSLIIVIHELGHFLFARLFKCRVEKFYLFFDWKFSLLKKKIGQTEYGIGWIPLGGYVKISGMVDESMDKDQLAEAPKAWEYRSKPAWQRFFIIIGGVLMNVLLSIMIYIGLTYAHGDQYLSTADVRDGYEFSTTAQAIGFQNGDKIISIDGKTVDNCAALSSEILLASSRNVLVERGGEQVTVVVADSSIERLIKEKIFIFPRYPFLINSVDTTVNPTSSLLAAGDSILSIDGTPIRYFDELATTLLPHASDSVNIALRRGGDTIVKQVWVNADGKLGVFADRINIYPITTKEYDFFASIPAGIDRGINTLTGYFDQLGLIFSPETKAYKEVGGFITIGSIFPEQWSWMAFWSITAFLSIAIAVLNIMPIPALDGGHLIFIIYEMITRRAPSQKVMETAQMIGFILIIGLVILANGNDIIRLFQ